MPLKAPFVDHRAIADPFTPVHTMDRLIRVLWNGDDRVEE
jgi:hypothetical protein